MTRGLISNYVAVNQFLMQKLTPVQRIFAFRM